jgi:NitT/TauT family transport system substrate-binding protein
VYFSHDRATSPALRPFWRRQIIAAVWLLALWGLTVSAVAQDAIRIGVPTKTFWPTIIVQTAIDQKLFEKEGLKAELTIYRGGGEAFEALAANAADMVLVVPSFAAVGRTKGVDAKIVAAGGVRYSGWHLVVPKGSKLTKLEDLEGKKVGITSTGSSSDIAARWVIQNKKVAMTPVPLGGGGLVPNLLSGNVDAVVLYSPLTFELLKSGEIKSLVDFSKELPEHLATGWMTTDKLINGKPQVIQKTLNALFGSLDYLRKNRDAAIKIIAINDEIKPDIAAEEYDKTIMELVPDGSLNLEFVKLSLDLSKLIGMTGMAPAEEIFTTQFKPVPTKLSPQR